MDYAAAKSLARDARRSDLWGARPRVSIALGGSVATAAMEDAVVATLWEEGFSTEVHHTPFAGWVTEALGSDGPDVWVIWLGSLGLSRGGTVFAEPDWAAMTAGVEALVARQRRVIVILPEPLPEEVDPFASAAAWRSRVCQRAIQTLPGSVITMSLTGLVAQHGLSNWHDARYWERAKMAAVPDAVALTGSLVGRTVARMHRPLVRAIAVDLDDTLWGGILSEVGPDGIDLDPDGSGRPFLQLQRYLKDLSLRGTPLALVSKNDDALVRETFARRPEMVLTLDDFAAVHASWEPKHVALSRFAKQVNIGVDAVCFLDDSSLERDEAQSILPGLIVPPLAEDPRDRVAELAGSGLFLQPVVDETDLLRARELRSRIAAHAELEQAERGNDLDDYLAGLDMRLEISAIDGENFDRALSLLHKTNQFNATLWRPSAGDLRRAVEDESVQADVFRLVDRVADSGIISVLISRVSDGKVEVLAWVLSCRVFGRGVEWAIAGYLAERAQSFANGTVSVPFQEGPRNGLMPRMLATMGLHRQDESDAAGRAVYAGVVTSATSFISLLSR